MARPLTGPRAVDLGGIGPGPHAAMLLAGLRLAPPESRTGCNAAAARWSPI